MHVYTRCKFCNSEIAPSRITEAYCNKECKRLKDVYGSVSAWRKNSKSGLKKGSRKTKATRAQPEPKPIKDHKQLAKALGGTLIRTGKKGTYAVPVQVSNGSVGQQFLLIMDYGEVAPLLLTGGAITPQKEENDTQNQTPSEQ